MTKGFQSHFKVVALLVDLKVHLLSTFSGELNHKLVNQPNDNTSSTRFNFVYKPTVSQIGI